MLNYKDVHLRVVWDQRVIGHTILDEDNLKATLQLLKTRGSRDVIFISENYNR